MSEKLTACACGQHVFVKLTRGFTAVASPIDAHLISGRSWAAKIDRNTVYARAHAKGKRTELMHRVILNARKGQIVDHIDGNALNNIRENLRFATPLQNIANTMCQNRHGYKGICFHKRCRSRPWQAIIRVKGTQKSIGYFDTKEEAARAYDDVAFSLHGEFARLNFPRALEGSEG